MERRWLFAAETFVWGLQGMCHLQRIPFAPDLVLQQVAPPYDLISLQHAAETLGLPPEQITARLGDSGLPTAPVEGGSWGAASTGAAVQLACQAVGKKLLKAAGKIAGAPLGDAKIDDVFFEDGCIVLKDAPTVRVPFSDAMRAADLTEIEEEETAAPGFGDMWTGLHKSKNTHSAIFAEVKVDGDWAWCASLASSMRSPQAASSTRRPRAARSSAAW